MIKVRDLKLGFSSATTKKILLENVSFNIEKGKLYSILGSNGKGKTTLLKAFAGFHKPLKGDIFIEDKSIKSYSIQKLAHLISVVFTERISVDYMSVFEMLALGRVPHTGFYGTLSENDLRVIDHALELCEISNFKDRKLNTLSDGEFQRVLIAKAIAQETPIILMDEPSSHLDAAGRITIMELLRKLVVENNKTIVLTMHEIDLAIKFSDTVLMFNDNNDIKLGMPEDLILSGEINELFVSKGLVFSHKEGVFKTDKVNNLSINLDLPLEKKMWVESALHRYSIFSKPSMQEFEISENDSGFIISKNGKIVSKHQNIKSIIDIFIST